MSGERPPGGEVAEGEVAEQPGVDVDGQLQRRFRHLLDGEVGLSLGAQLEQVETFASVQLHQGPSPVGVGYHVGGDFMA